MMLYATMNDFHINIYTMLFKMRSVYEFHLNCIYFVAKINMFFEILKNRRISKPPVAVISKTQQMQQFFKIRNYYTFKNQQFLQFQRSAILLFKNQ